MEKQYCVYVLASERQTLYVGVSNDLVRRVWQHRQGEGSKFTARYKVTKLVYYETTNDVRAAIEREKQIKGWVRAKKIALIRSMNPAFDDLSLGWFAGGGSDDLSR